MATATATAEQASTTPAEPVKDDRVVELDEFGQAAKERTVALINSYNADATQLKAIGGDRQQLLDTLRQNSDDPKAKELSDTLAKIEAKREELFAQRDAILNAQIDKIQADNSGSLAQLTEKVDAGLKKIKALVTLMCTNYDCQAGDLGLPELVKRTGRSGGSATGSGKGGKRVRGFDFYVNGTLATLADANGNKRSNLAAAAKVAGVDTSTMQQAFWAVAGQDAANYPDNAKFTVTGKDNAVFNVEAIKTGVDAAPDTSKPAPATK